MAGGFPTAQDYAEIEAEWFHLFLTSLYMGLLLSEAVEEIEDHTGEDSRWMVREYEAGVTFYRPVGDVECG